MAPSTKANYKTYEAQARLLRALVAAHPDIKWNYKDIAKYFGASTADGMQYQFRTIKKDAESLRGAVDSNNGPAAVPLKLAGAGSGSSAAMSTPPQVLTKPKANGHSSGKSTTKTTPRTQTPLGRQQVKVENSNESDATDEDDSSANLSASRSRVPVGRVTKQSPRTPSSRAAAANAARAIASSAIDIPSDSEGDKNHQSQARNTSLFGPFGVTTAVKADSRFLQAAADPWIGGGSFKGSGGYLTIAAMAEGEI